MEKIDLFKLHKEEYVAPKQPALINIKPAKYLAIEGQGKPGSEPFQAQIGALYGIAYTIKFTRKLGGIGPDFKVCALQGLYWGDDSGRCLFEQPIETMHWKLLIRVPDFIKAPDLKVAVKSLREKGKEGPFEEVALETLREGKCVQVLHVGPYDQEAGTVERMRAFAEGQGLRLSGAHHEIYMSDPRRVAPEKLRTILRHPVAAASQAASAKAG